MEAHFRIFLLIILMSKSAIGQDERPYYDAIELARLFNKYQKQSPPVKIPLSDPNVIAILESYFKNSTDLDAEINSHPLLKDYFSSGGNASINSTSLLNTRVGVSSLGALDVSTLADGFAKFLVKRTKEELNAAFFNKFYDLISKPEYKDAQLLFPFTYGMLQAIGSEIYNYEAYLNGLREAFEKDLHSLLPSLKKVIEDGTHSSFFTANPQLKAICLSSIYVGDGLLKKNHPGQIIADFPIDYLSDPSLLNVKGSMQTLRLFSESIRSTGTTQYWITTEELAQLIQDPISLNIYFGLIYQQAKNENIQFKNGVRLDTIIAKGSDQRKALEIYLKELQKLANVVTRSIESIKDLEKDKVSFEHYFSLYSSSLDLIEHASSLYKVQDLKLPKPDDKLLTQISLARAGGNIALDINRRNYSSAIIGIYELYASTITDKSAEPVKPFILKYGAFMAAVVQAEDSDEVAAAIEAVALPSGSSRIKRESAFNVSLNSYVGLFTGYERIKGVDNDGFKFNSYGVAAPIGISISRGHSILFLGTGDKGWKEGKKGWSSSLFLSVVDIGALAAFRFANDTIETVPNVELKDIISPGVFLSIGIPKAPLSFNLGYQAGPLLRKVDEDLNLEYNQNYTRFSISLCVDIPLVNFYTKQHN